MSQPPSLEARFAEAMGQYLGPDFPEDIALAVSGGGDSMAMLVLAHNWARVWGVRLWVVTVDHGLREASAAEAAMVARECAALGHSHCTLRWRWDGQGNVQAAAREARLTLMDRWRGLITHVLFAHTRDDVAETYLTRLARGAGVEGLARMQGKRRVSLPGATGLEPEEFDGALPPQDRQGLGTRVRPGWFHVVRPCLEMSRSELRHHLSVLKTPWVDDPSNEDPRFDRVRMRQAQPQLDALGLDAATLEAAAKRMARASDALRARAVQVWRQIGCEGRSGHIPTGELLLDRDGFEQVERDTQMRLLSYACSYVSGQTYRPRETAVEDLLDRLLGGGGGTLHGCEARMEQKKIRIWREFVAVRDCVVSFDPLTPARHWDGRWSIALQPRQHIRALGEDGWAQCSTCPTRPDDAPPFHSARSLPSLWAGKTLLSCPAMGVGSACARLTPFGKTLSGFAAFLLSH